MTQPLERQCSRCNRIKPFADFLAHTGKVRRCCAMCRKKKREGYQRPVVSRMKACDTTMHERNDILGRYRRGLIYLTKPFNNIVGEVEHERRDGAA